MKNIQTFQFIIVCLTFITTVIASILGYFIQKDKKKISNLENQVSELEKNAAYLSKKLRHGIENLQQYYELEKMIANDRKETHRQFQKYMRTINIIIIRKGFSPREMENMLKELKC